ncbi:hypothetical protein Tco_0515150 [Tanacetum coccineum]
MSTLVFVDPESSTQADGAQISRVPVPLPKDPYEVIRQVYLDGTDTEYKPFEDTIDTETPESPLAIASDIPLSESTPPVLVPILCRTARMVVRVPHAMSLGLSTGMAEVAAMFESTFLGFVEEDDAEEDESGQRRVWISGDNVSKDTVDEVLLQRMRILLREDKGLTTGVEGPDMDDKGYGLDDESRGIDEEGHSIDSDGLGLEEEEEAVPGEEGDVYSTFEVGQGSVSAPESERPERVSTFRQPTLTTWTDPKDDIWFISISPSPSDDPSPISSPMIPLTVPSLIATPAAVKTEGFLTELGVQLVEERRARLELVEVIDGMRRGQEPRGGDMIGRNRPWMVTESNGKSCGDRFGNLIIRLTVFWNGLPRMGRAEMVDEARFAWGFLSVFGNANSDRVAITSRTGSYPDTRLRQ